MANKREWADKIEDAVVEQLLNIGWTRTSYRSFVTVLGAYRVSLNSSNKQTTIKIQHVFKDRTRQPLSITKVESNKDVISINNSVYSPRQTSTLVLEPFQVKVDVKTNLVDLARQVVELSVIPILINNITVSNVPKYKPSKERETYLSVLDLICEHLTQQGYEIVDASADYSIDKVIFNVPTDLDRTTPYFDYFLGLENKPFYRLELEKDMLTFGNFIPNNQKDDVVLKVSKGKYKIFSSDRRHKDTLSGTVPADPTKLVEQIYEFVDKIWS